MGSARINGCTKRAWLYWSDAEKRAKQIGLKTYQCPYCKMFHLTSQNTAKKKLEAST